MVNGRGPFRTTYEVMQDVQYVRSEMAVEPDRTWQHTDPAGHFHAFDHESKLPTLNAIPEHVDCDGSCGGVCEGEGYTITRHECLVCRAPVEPAWVPDMEARTTGTPVLGLKDWNARVDGAAIEMIDHLVGERVSVVITEEDGRTLFGFGIIVKTAVESGFGEMRMTATIYGAGPLSQRL